MNEKTHKNLYALEVSIFDVNQNFQITKDFFKTENKLEIIKKAQDIDFDILCLKFNVEENTELTNAVEILNNLLPTITKPLIIEGSGNDNIDKILLPELIKVLDRECIICSANENTYNEIVPAVIQHGHKLVLKSPIDINLCKELNILAYDLGLPLDKIIIDTDIGGLGYGLDYGYSIMEKIKLENDEYLNMPLISFATTESLKTKETKSDTFSSSWGNLPQRTMMFEITSAVAAKAAGTNIIVLHHPDSIKALKGLI